MCIFCLYGGQRQCLELYQCETDSLWKGVPISLDPDGWIACQCPSQEVCGVCSLYSS